MCRNVIQSKDDERSTVGPRWKLYFERHDTTSKEPPSPWIPRAHFRYTSRNEKEVPLISECIAWHGIRGCWRSTYQFVSRSLSLQLLRGCNGSFERRVASSACSLWWTWREYSYLAANLHARRLIREVLDPILSSGLGVAKVPITFISFE